MASVLHTHDNVIKEVKQCIWDGGSSKIAYDVIIQQIQDGGLKLIYFGEKIKALKIIWVKRLTVGTPQRWKVAPTVFYKTSSFSDYFSSNQNPIINISQFYQDVQKYWLQAQIVETCIAKEIPVHILNETAEVIPHIVTSLFHHSLNSGTQPLAIVCVCVCCVQRG